MGLFEMGAEDDEQGFVEYGPEDVYAKIRATDSEMDAVNALVPGSKLPSARKKAWAAVFAKWKEWNDRHSGVTGLPSLMRDQSFRVAGQFSAAAAKVRGEIEGGGVALPPAGPGTAPIKNVNGAGSPYPWEWKFPWKPVLIVGGVAVGGYFLYRYFSRGRDVTEPINEELAKNPAPLPVLVMLPAGGAK